MDLILKDMLSNNFEPPGINARSVNKCKEEINNETYVKKS